MRLRLLLLVPAALLVCALPGAYATPGADPGVTSTSVLVGGTVPLTGPEVAYAAIGRGAEAYFRHVNARGGVHGRKIEYTYLDDAYDPAQTVQQTRRLVQQDRVFAIFNSVGTEHVLAVRPYLNEVGVPQLFVGSGSSAIAREHQRYPWTMGYLPSFSAEAAVYGRHIVRALPRARVGVLRENSPYGEDMRNGLRRGLGRKASTIVAEETYEVTDSDVSSQVARLKSAGANTFMIFALPKQTIQAFLAAARLNWRPQIYVNSVSIDPFVMEVVRTSVGKRATEGAISTAFLKDPTDPALARDPGVRLYKQIVRRYLGPRKEKEVAHLYGMAVAFTMVHTLRQAGKNLTRKALLQAATHLKETNNPFLVKGIAVRTTPDDYFPIATTRLLRHHNGRWRQFGGFVNLG